MYDRGDSIDIEFVAATGRASNHYVTVWFWKNYTFTDDSFMTYWVISSPRSYTTYELASQTIQRLLYAATVGPKSLYEDVHASTGHPGYVGMRWHQRNTIGANYTDKDAASTRGICQGCALGSAHQYPTNQHYVLSNIPYDPGQ